MGKKPETPSKPTKVYTQYEVAGDAVKRKNISCPKCGAGTALSNHKNRKHCGRCGYTEFTKAEKAEA